MMLLAQTVDIPTKFFTTSAPRWSTLCTINRRLNPSFFSTCNITPLSFITVFLPNLLLISGVIFFFIMIGAGWAVLAGAGKDQSAQDKAKAQAALTYSVAGFLLIISAYFILQIIGTITGINFIQPNIFF